MSNKKIRFQKLVNICCPYTSVEQLQILEWMFKSGKGYNIRKYRWHVFGVDQLLYNYSGNTHKSFTSIKSWDYVRLMFINAIVPECEIQNWRDDFGIKLDGYKFLRFDNSDNQYLKWNDKRFFHIIELLQGKKLKKSYCHPNYEDRTDPYITKCWFTISESGCHIFLEFTFNIPGYERNSWRKEFWKRDETMSDFLGNSLKEIDNNLLEPFIF